MVDAVSPFTISPPPPPSSSSSSSSSSSKSNTPMLYYGLVVVGIAAVVLAIYNLIIIKRCSRQRMQSQPTRPRGLVNDAVTVNSRSFENYSSNRNLLSSFKYKKEATGGGGGGGEGEGEGKEQQGGGGRDYECPVCLSVFEEGEEVRKLPRCKHSFHAICIDMWLYSHFDCPVCRTPVGPFSYCRFPADINRPPDNSRDEFLEAGLSVGGVRGS